MTDRAHLYRLVQDDQGNLLPNVTVTLYEPGTATPITDTIYADNSSTETYTNPFISSDGQVDFYLEAPRRVKLGIQITDQVPEFYDNLDVLLAGAAGTSTGGSGGPLLLTSPDGSVYEITISDDGALISTQVS